MLLILMWPISSYWSIIDFHITSFHHTNVLLILMVPHTSILMCYWFSCDLIPEYWCVIDSHVTSLRHTNGVTDYHVISFQHNNVIYIVVVSHSSILMCYWFSYNHIPAYLSIDDYNVTSFQHTDVLLILMWPHSSILFIDFHISLQSTDVLLNLLWPHSGIHMYYSFSW